MLNMWCARLYKKVKDNVYLDLCTDIMYDDGKHEIEYIRRTQNNPMVKDLKERREVTHFQLFYLTDPTVNGIPQTRKIEL